MMWLWIFIAFMAGAAFGLITMSCFVVAREDDDRLEKLNNDEAGTEQKACRLFLWRWIRWIGEKMQVTS